MIGTLTVVAAAARRDCREAGRELSKMKVSVSVSVFFGVFRRTRGSSQHMLALLDVEERRDAEEKGVVDRKKLCTLSPWSIHWHRRCSRTKTGDSWLSLDV